MLAHIEYSKLLTIVSWGVFNRTVRGTGCYTDDLKPIKNAIHGGLYIGSPGKDIFLMLPYLSDEQMKEVAVKLREVFPNTPPLNHVNIAACIRFIYGQFERNGCLRSNEDCSLMKEKTPNWFLPRKFLKLLFVELKDCDNYYGLCILCEMEGHRIGDEAIICDRQCLLEKMEKTYLESVKYAFKCNSYKQMWTPYFWSARYFAKARKKRKAIEYCKLTIKNGDKYCSDSRPSYVSKFLFCLEYLKNNDTKNWNSFYGKYKKSIRHKNLKKAINIIKKV